MLEEIHKFEKGTTIYFECLYRDIDGTPIDPASPAWTIKNIQGNTVASGTPAKRKDGVWYFFWIAGNSGSFLLTFSGTIQSNQVIIRKRFGVRETTLK